MKLAITTLLTFIFTASAFASENDHELDQVCAPTAMTYAQAVARVQFPHAKVIRVKLLRNGYSETPSTSSQIWNVDISDKAAFVTSVIVHTYRSESGSCEVSKIIPNAIQ